ncbi:MAG: replicative DNA helicase [Planctomycetota bacterium]
MADSGQARGRGPRSRIGGGALPPALSREGGGPGRPPPHDDDAERAVLGSLLLDNTAIDRATEVLSPQDFYRPPHQAIYQAILEAYGKGQAVDLVLLKSVLQAKGALESAGGVEAVAALLDAVPSAAHLEHYARIVRDCAVLRGLLEAAASIEQMALERRGEVQTILDESERLVFEIHDRRRLGETKPLHDLVKAIFDQIDAISQGEHFTGVRTGFRDLDDYTSGLQKAEMIVLAARPSVGKTSLALNIALNVALGHPAREIPPVPVGFFSLEMSAQQIAQNLVCMQSGVNSHRLRRGTLAREGWQAISDAVSHLSEAPIFIDDSSSLSPFSLRAKARRLKASQNVGLVIIDYLQLMDSSMSFDSRQQEITFISRSLKALARELSVPVLAISQLNRASEMREEHRPRMSDLRESGAIEQDADVVLLLWREDYQAAGEKEAGSGPGSAHLSIAKQRNGPTGEVRLAFLKESMKFTDFSLEQGGPERR